MLLSNDELRYHHALLYNDAILGFYIGICTYMIVSNKFYFASMFLSLAISIKIGAILMLPTFLGLVQLHYGTIQLLIVILIMLSI
jgi:predicted membrane-bound dolichyl-phosphate-mannose-protein mannosyltransferase